MRLIAYTNMPGSHVHVHKLGCRDLRKPIYRLGDQIEFGTTDWSSKTAFGLDYWSDINAERKGEHDWLVANNGKPEEIEYYSHGYVFEDLKFFPCTDALPDEEPEQKLGFKTKPQQGFSRNLPEPIFRGRGSPSENLPESIFPGRGDRPGNFGKPIFRGRKHNDRTHHLPARRRSG